MLIYDDRKSFYGLFYARKGQIADFFRDSHHCEPLMRDYSWLCPHKKSAFTTLSYMKATAKLLLFCETAVTLFTGKVTLSKEKALFRCFTLLYYPSS